jgi:hypothetical protein
MALKQLDAQPRFKSVNVSDNGGVVNAQYLGGSADRALPSNLIRRAHLVPMLHDPPLCKYSHQLRLSSYFVR